MRSPGSVAGQIDMIPPLKINISSVSAGYLAFFTDGGGGVTAHANYIFKLGPGGWRNPEVQRRSFLRLSFGLLWEVARPLGHDATAFDTIERPRLTRFYNRACSVCFMLAKLRY